MIYPHVSSLACDLPKKCHDNVTIRVRVRISGRSYFLSRSRTKPAPIMVWNIIYNGRCGTVKNRIFFHLCHTALNIFSEWHTEMVLYSATRESPGSEGVPATVKLLVSNLNIPPFASRVYTGDPCCGYDEGTFSIYAASGTKTL